MTQFHEGQQVEVIGSGPTHALPYWSKAKIVNELRWHSHGGGYYVHSTDNDQTGWTHSEPIGKFTVQFPDGASAVFDAEHIRVRCPACGQENPAHLPNQC